MALMQAVAFADDDAQTAMLERLAYGSGELTEISGPPALVEAVRAARVANNGPISIEDARVAAEIAATGTPCRSKSVAQSLSARQPSARRRGAGSTGATTPIATCRNCRGR